ncbi:alpha/beta hydrolase [Bradyrhizobium sp. 180]|nr:alpha/beta hydrolase [Bradyrhizobium sp. CW12]MCK1492445.1 alpha/beta hydrolase [Bradyrhizobium sp. 180]MCK1532775.1 alpha/beta hydrolase [Bradyrhizobium sp. 182]MCK1597829.1 alpha/beta hydrolase [Bradyrhizobium sp. 164]MCK1616570.1 alpha/beta hydrolase [Bradyrhizobium sp. 159]MCK1644798.1 alpha/beta hydrolase [Bradyrhizobium sp. 154]MCK1663709.1 alpha/beta hydrolase [Bradyrhizobium sp. 153]MCK1754909.1 alpha/beta hydrolase [Bradyrhizobium sp. 137]
MRRSIAIATTLLSLQSASAGPMPPDKAEAVKAMGAVINAPETGKLYAPLQAKEPYENVTVDRNIKYGQHERNLLDVFRATTAEARPVLIFVHGGGYERGDKRAGSSPYYDNVMLWATKNGMVGVNMTYRLAPDYPWPAAADDVASAVAWTKEKIRDYGGDPNRIFLMGHSAGASHVGSYLARAAVPVVVGAILVSGTYDLRPQIEVAGQKSYFGADTELWRERSSLNGLAQSKLPLLVVRGEIDVPYYIDQAETLKAAMCANNHCQTFAVLKGHSHMSEIYSVNTEDTTLTDTILAFVKGLK